MRKRGSDNTLIVASGIMLPIVGIACIGEVPVMGLICLALGGLFIFLHVRSVRAANRMPAPKQPKTSPTPQPAPPENAINGSGNADRELQARLMSALRRRLSWLEQEEEKRKEQADKPEPVPPVRTIHWGSVYFKERSKPLQMSDGSWSTPCFTNMKQCELAELAECSGKSDGLVRRHTYSPDFK